MTGITAWGVNWPKGKGVLEGRMSEEDARRRFEAGRQVAAEVRLPGGVCAEIEHSPRIEILTVGLRGWPAGTKDRGSLFFQVASDGGFELHLVGVVRGLGAACWAQTANLGRRNAVLVHPVTAARYEAPLPQSADLAEAAALRFPVPAFGDYAPFVRPDLVERCILGLDAFGPDLPPGLEGAKEDPAPLLPR